MITQKGAVHNNVIWPTFGASGVVVTVRMFLVFMFVLVFLVVMLLVMIVLVFMFFVVVMFVRMIRRALEVKRFVW